MLLVCVRAAQLDCTEPAAAPRSERGDPEAVVRLEADRTSTFYIIAALARQYLQAGHKVFVHVFLCFSTPCIPPRSDRVQDVCTQKKIPQFPSFGSPKSYRPRGEKGSPKKWDFVVAFRAVKHCVVLIFLDSKGSTCSWT